MQFCACRLEAFSFLVALSPRIFDSFKFFFQLEIALALLKVGQEKNEKNDKSGKTGSVFTWKWLNRFATVLIIMTSILFLMQLGYMPSLRMKANEIAPEDIDVKFEDVKGCDEAKKELEIIVEFLMNPDKFSSLGGKLPKGVLLSGKP